jgi:hypothetical protein
MPKFTLSTPDWSKTFDNYRKYSVPTGAGADDNTTIKVPVFDTGNLEAALYWRKQFADLIDLKQLDAAAKFNNARILTSGSGREKWNQARQEVLREGQANALNPTDARFNATMLIFLKKCGATSETAEDLREFLANAKKPSNMSLDDFKKRIHELNEYLPYLPGPLNTKLSEDELFVCNQPLQNSLTI